MSQKYSHLLSPIKVGNVVFKNRLIASPGNPYLSQGPEHYPSDSIITHYGNKAKNGAALVIVSGAARPGLASKENLLQERVNNPNIFNPDHGWHMGSGRDISYDFLNGGCQNLLSELTEAVHFYGARALMNVEMHVPPYDASAGNRPMVVFGSGISPGSGKEIPEEMMEKIADEFALQAALMKEVGFDGVHLHMAYRLTILGRFLSPLTNRRTDKFGGSLENRARFPIMFVDRVKQRCGRDFLVEAAISGCEPQGGFTLQDTVEYAKLFAGHIDLLQIKATDIDATHCTGFNPERTPFLYMAEAIKKSGTKIAVITNGGYEDLDACEEIIASGKSDFIGMARAWITNPDLGIKAYEGRNEDVVPCIRCNACHVSSYYKPWVSVCSVNPTWGLEHRIGKMIQPPADKKKVAVVGGGPAGMEAALVAAGRGHKVTLYEKSEALGGLFKTISNVSFKWPHKDFKNYLVRQIGKANVDVRLNTEATPDMLKKDEYDAVIVAVGADPIVPGIPGINGKNVVFAADVFGKEDALAKNVAVIGGGEVGVETAMHLAEKGHKVTVLEMGNMLAPKSIPIHYYSMFREAWEKLENFNAVVNAICTRIEADKVTYKDADGAAHTIEAGSVVIAAGMKAKDELAMKFYGAGNRLFMIGDCDVAGDLQKAMRSAFSAASQL